jgi:hypothetical protein
MFVFEITSEPLGLVNFRTIVGPAATHSLPTCCPIRAT